MCESILKAYLLDIHYILEINEIINLKSVKLLTAAVSLMINMM